jgi:hypothetical protein
MSERDGYQHGVPCWVDTWQPDADAAVEFYKRIFGWEAEDTMPADVSGKHYMCRLRGRDAAAVASRPEEAPPVTAWNTYVWVNDVDATVAKVKEAGGGVLKEPFDALDGGWIAIVADPAGAAIGIWQPGAHKGARVINEPGAWAMSMLVTPDPKNAKRFYGELFGWTTRSFGLGDEEITMFAVPGYVGGEPQQPVPRDVVATLAPPGAAPDGTPPHWSVDFWVRDADEVARVTAEMGGQVLAEPYDVPDIGMRQAALVDPQGAAFTITRPPGL